MELIGTNHGIKTVDMFGRPKELDTWPSTELLLKLSMLPKSAKVGIECFKPKDFERWHFPDINFKRLLSEGIEIPWQVKSEELTALKYWQPIFYAINNKHNVVFLDDPDFHIQSWRSRFLSYELKEHWRSAYENSLFENEPITDEENKKMLCFEKEALRLSLEADYLMAIAREPHILNNMLDADLDVAIIGAGHSDYFVDNSHTSSLLNITNYSKDIINPDNFFIYDSSESKNKFISNASPDRKTLAERECLRRKYLAASIGRICPEKTPDFLGSWNTNSPEDGLFKIYINDTDEEKIHGIIEDTLGTARFFGTLIPGKKLVFWKNYQKEATLIGGSDRTLLYSADFTNGEYSGFFGATGLPMSRSFWVREY